MVTLNITPCASTQVMCSRNLFGKGRSDAHAQTKFSGSGWLLLCYGSLLHCPHQSIFVTVSAQLIFSTTASLSSSSQPSCLCRNQSCYPPPPLAKANNTVQRRAFLSSTGTQTRLLRFVTISLFQNGVAKSGNRLNRQLG